MFLCQYRISSISKALCTYRRLGFKFLLKSLKLKKFAKLLLNYYCVFNSEYSPFIAKNVEIWESVGTKIETIS